MSEDYAVVDLQNLDLNKIEVNGQVIQIGATVTLQQFSELSRTAAEFSRCDKKGSKPKYTASSHASWNHRLF